MLAKTILVVSLFHSALQFKLNYLTFDIDCEFGQETFVSWIWTGLQISGLEILRGLGVGLT